MDPVAQSALAAIADLELAADAVRTLRKYWIADLAADRAQAALRQACWPTTPSSRSSSGRLPFERLELGSPYQFQLVTVPLRSLDDDALVRLSREGQLYLSLVEMQTIQAHFRQLDRDPTDVELETIAQTWSEHCSHKTLAGRIAYSRARGRAQFRNMLKETIFAATDEIRQSLGEHDWCVSVFSDNAGVIRFDDEYNVVFKVETHNHPSALEPYGGANTGIGGVIRDPLGTGHGRQADLQHRRVLLRPARHAGRRRAAGRAASAARDAGRRGRSARLRQPDGHSHRQRRDLFRSALPGQSAGVLRQRRPDSPRQVVQASRGPATTSWPSAAAPGATAFTARRSAPPN